jgi:hypothetical protein
VHDYLMEAFNLEIVFPSLHVVHGTFATAPGDLIFAGLGGEIVDEAETAQAEEALLCYSGWEAEYRLRILSEFDEYPLVLLFATPPAHKGLGESGSGVVAELIERFSPRVAIVGGRDPKHGVLGRSLVVSPGRLVDGCYAVVDLDSGTAEQSQLPDRITVAAAPTSSSPDAASPITATQRSRLDESWRGPISRNESRKPDKRTQEGGSAMTAIPIESRKELAYRTSNGIEVTLFWEKPTSRVAVRVSDMQLGESFEFEVEGANALDAFHHPYAYAASQGVKSSVAPIDALLAYAGELRLGCERGR